MCMYPDDTCTFIALHYLIKIQTKVFHSQIPKSLQTDLILSLAALKTERKKTKLTQDRQNISHLWSTNSSVVKLFNEKEKDKIYNKISKTKIWMVRLYLLTLH